MQSEHNTRAADTASPSQHEAASVAKGLICRETTECVAEAFANQLLALVLTGSLARNEATVIEENGNIKLLGDAEFLLVFADGAALPSAHAVHNLRSKIEGRLAQARVVVRLDLSPVPSGFLRGMSPHIFAYELKTHGQVLRGDQQALSLIPAFSAADIPLEDGWRLLCNRIIEVLEAAGEAEVHAGYLSPALHYTTIKLYQDMATSYLVFAGGYEPSYRARAERLARMAANPQHATDLSFRLADFSDRVSACTRFKLSPPLSVASNDTGCPASADFMRAAIADAHALWRWELARLIGDQGRRSDADLMTKWIRMVPLGPRIRGWAHVVRNCGWHRSIGRWPRWLRLAMQSSPRYCVYAAASELYFNLPEALGLAPQTANPDKKWAEIRSWLPTTDRIAKRITPGCRQLIREISDNYASFLKDTRS